MDNRIFLNNDVARITGTTPRQVLAWTEKGLIIPFRETTGAGTKRGYNYTNLLEVFLCRNLFIIGIGVQTIKKILNHLRTSRMMQEWAENFNNYYMERFKEHKESFERQLAERLKNKKYDEHKELTELGKKIFKQPDVPDKPVGILLILYSDDGENVSISPWDMEYTIHLNSVKDAFVASFAVFVIDLGKMKALVDKKL